MANNTMKITVQPQILLLSAPSTMHSEELLSDSTCWRYEMVQDGT